MSHFRFYVFPVAHHTWLWSLWSISESSLFEQPVSVSVSSSNNFIVYWYFDSTCFITCLSLVGRNTNRHIYLLKLFIILRFQKTFRRLPQIVFCSIMIIAFNFFAILKRKMNGFRCYFGPSRKGEKPSRYFFHPHVYDCSLQRVFIQCSYVVLV